MSIHAPLYIINVRCKMNFVKKYWIKQIGLYISFFIVIYLYNPQLAIPFLLAALLIKNSSNPQLIFTLVSLTFYFLFSGFNTLNFSLSSYIPILSGDFESPNFYLFITILAKIMVFSSVYLFIRLNKIKLFLFITFIFLGTLNIYYKTPDFGHYLIVFYTLVLTKLIWPALYLNKSAKLNFHYLGIISPFWENESLQQAPKLTSVTNIDDMLINQELAIKGLKLILWGLILRFFGMIVYSMVFTHSSFIFELPSLNLVNYKTMGLHVYNNLSLDLWQRWTAVIAHNIFFLSYDVAGTSAVIVGCARFVGFDIFRNTYKPYNAKSFHDFFVRYFYYYNQLILNFFFFPIYRNLIFLKNKNYRIYITIFLSIFCGAFLIHLSREPHRFFIFKNINDYIIFVACYLPYIFGLAFSLTLSVFLERQGTFKNWKLPDHPSLKYIRFLFYLLIYSVIHSLHTNHHMLNLREQIIFILRLFNI